jgi:hypothetical protein
MRKTILEPMDGDTRTIKRFLWLPLTIDGERRWLETAEWVEIYQHEDVLDLFGHTPMIWRPYYWDPE